MQKKTNNKICCTELYFVSSKTTWKIENSEKVSVIIL